DQGRCVSTRWNVEGAPGIQAEQTVVAGAIQVDQHCRQLRSVVRRRVTRRGGFPQPVEPPPPYLVEVLPPAAPMTVFQGRQRGNRVVDGVTHHAVAADDVRVDVREPHLAAFEKPAIVAVEKNGAAAKERFDVSSEFNRVVRAQLRQELSLAAGPLEDRPDRGVGGPSCATPDHRLTRRRSARYPTVAGEPGPPAPPP